MTPEQLGVSSEGLARARAFVEARVEGGDLAGAVLMAARHDEVAQVACVGLRDIEASLPITPDTIFQIASMTKLITSVGVMMLVESGRLDLGDPVSRYVPELGGVTVFAGIDGGTVRTVAPERPITIEQLLTHTSGLAYDAPHPVLEGQDDDFGDYRYELPEFIRRLVAHPLAHQPGDGWRYGWSHDVLGRVIEVVADEAFDAYLERTVFAPLGMVDSGFRVPPEKAGRLATVYQPVDGALQRIDNDETRAVLGEVRLLQGGGGCVSTAPDFLRFSRMLLRGGELDGVRLLGRATLEQMTRNRLAAPLYPIDVFGRRFNGEGYGLGVGVIVEPELSEMAGSRGTYEWAGSWNTYVRCDPVKDLVGLFLAQYEPFDWGAIGDEYWSLVWEAASA